MREEISLKLSEIISTQKHMSASKDRIHNSVTNLQKDVNRLMTEKLNLLKCQKKTTDQVNSLISQKNKLEIQLNNEMVQLNDLKSNLSKFTQSFKHNKKLSESVNLDQSRLETVLTSEMEIKQELVSKIHRHKQSINESKLSNSRLNVSQKFINASVINDDESEKSFNCDVSILDIADISCENMIQQDKEYFEEKEFTRSIPESLGDLVTQATKRGKRPLFTYYLIPSSLNFQNNEYLLCFNCF